MIRNRLALIFIASISTLAFAGSAPAATVTIGSPLTASFETESCGEDPCTVVATGFDEPGAVVRAPANGTIVRWRMVGAAPGFQYRLRVIGEAPGSLFTGAGISAPVSGTGSGVQTFPASLPIKAGQLIGIDLEADAPLGVTQELVFGADTYAYFDPVLAEGETRFSESFPGEIAFNADVQPPPVVSAISPGSGSFKGGTSVTITGSDFSGTTAVSFGGLPAQSFAVLSDTQINAVAPASPEPGNLPVAVTTVAGTATAPAGFQFQACAVPKLKGKKLKGAKKRSRRSLCKVGKVKKIRDATAKTGEVVKQRPKPGALLPPGAKIKITLAP